MNHGMNKNHLVGRLSAQSKMAFFLLCAIYQFVQVLQVFHSRIVTQSPFYGIERCSA